MKQISNQGETFFLLFKINKNKLISKVEMIKLALILFKKIQIRNLKKKEIVNNLINLKIRMMM